MLYSFDVFDTLITRKTATPEGIFALVQEELQRSSYSEFPSNLRNHFLIYRIHAEELARSVCRNENRQEVLLSEIYQALQLLGLTEQQKNQLMELEVQTELENIFPIQENIQRLKQYVAKGQCVVLISDMYLDKKVIGNMLHKIDPIFDTIPLYVSSESMESKWHGSLYQYIKEQEHVAYEEWVHIGDNIESDVRVPKSLGIQSEHYQSVSMLDFEKQILEKKREIAYIQLSIGASLYARRYYQDITAFRMGASLGGPILYAYVCWILEECIKRSINKLYFIARDGYFPKLIADQLIKENQYKIETHYLYGSRKAWKMIAMEEQDDLAILLNSSYMYRATSICDVAELLELTESQLYEILPQLRRVQKESFTPVIRNYCYHEIIVHQKSVISYLQNALADRRKKAVQYLMQEIDIQREDTAYVEIGGTGYTQGCLARLTKPFRKNKIRTFYFKRDTYKDVEDCEFFVYLPSFLDNNIAIEMLTRAPENQTIGYEESHGKMRPIYLEGTGELKALQEHGIKAYEDGIRAYTTSFCKLNGNSNEAFKLVSEYFHMALETPDSEVLSYIGGMPNNASGREKRIGPFAPELTSKEAKRIFLPKKGQAQESLYKGTELQYSIMRSSKKVQAKIEKYKSKSKILHNWKEHFWYVKHYGLRIPKCFRCKKVVLYGAGKAGQKIYNDCRYLPGMKIILWVDKNYEQRRNEGLKVVNPSEILNMDYDQILIGVMNQKVADCIKKELLELGIVEEKMVWLDLGAR